jgi:hypothetical protein
MFRAAFNFRANENHALKNINMERKVENYKRKRRKIKKDKKENGRFG